MSYDYKQFYRRRLPHIHPPGAILFVTFRLAGSIPKTVLKKWKAEKEWLEHELKRLALERRETDTTEALKHEARLIDFHRHWFLKFEEILHRADQGPTWLKEEGIARLVADSVEYRDGKVYRLDAYCIMSNHVHIVIKPFLDEKDLSVRPNSARLRYESIEPPLGVIMHSLKSYTANEANKLLKRSGAFWETESYDHLIRDEKEYHRVVAYVLNNPVKAGLVKNWQEWPWSWKRGCNKLPAC
jgi:putative transposase